MREAFRSLGCRSRIVLVIDAEAHGRGRHMEQAA